MKIINLLLKDCLGYPQYSLPIFVFLRSIYSLSDIRNYIMGPLC